MKKCIISITLILAMCLSLVPMAAFAATTTAAAESSEDEMYAAKYMYYTGSDGVPHFFSVETFDVSAAGFTLPANATQISGERYDITDHVRNEGMLRMTGIDNNAYNHAMSGVHNNMEKAGYNSTVNTDEYYGPEYVYEKDGDYFIFASVNRANKLHELGSYTQVYIVHYYLPPDEAGTTTEETPASTPAAPDGTAASEPPVEGENAAVSDTPSSDASEQVNAAIVANIVPEALQSKYTQATSRAEFTSLAVALYEAVTGTEIAERTTFSDTTDINVEKAAAIGVVTGVGGGVFDPGAGLTREQAAVMLARLAEAAGKPLEASAATFADNDSISEWATTQVGQIQAAGIMGGVGANTFAPQDPYTREQSIITIMRLYDYVTGA